MQEKGVKQMTIELINVKVTIGSIGFQNLLRRRAVDI